MNTKQLPEIYEASTGDLLRLLVSYRKGSPEESEAVGELNYRFKTLWDHTELAKARIAELERTAAEYVQLMAATLQRAEAAEAELAAVPADAISTMLCGISNDSYDDAVEAVLAWLKQPEDGAENAWMFGEIG